MTSLTKDTIIYSKNDGKAYKIIKIDEKEYTIEGIETDEVFRVTDEILEIEYFITNNEIALEFYDTDGYTEQTREYVKVPSRYIVEVLLSDDVQVHLTKEGEEWFRKKYFSSFDNGGYYRLRTLSQGKITKLLKRAINIIEVFSE